MMTVGWWGVVGEGLVEWWNSLTARAGEGERRAGLGEAYGVWPRPKSHSPLSESPPSEPEREGEGPEG